MENAATPLTEQADRLCEQALSLAGQRQDAHAERLWEEALALDPHHVESLYNLSLLQWRSGRIRVGEAIRRLAAAHAEPVRTALPLAYLHLARRAPGEAQRLLESLTRPDPPGAERDAAMASTQRGTLGSACFIALGHANMCQERFQAAAEAYAAALASSPGERAAVIGAHLAKARRRVEGKRVAFPLARRIAAADGPGEAPQVAAIAIDPQDRWAVLGCMDASIRVISLANGALLGLARIDGAVPAHLAIAGDGSMVHAGGEDGVVRTFALPALTEGRAHQDPQQGQATAITGLAVGPGTSSVLWTLRNGTLRIGDVAGGTPPRSLEGHKGPITGLAVPEGGRLAVTVSSDPADGALRIWDLASARCVKVWEGLGRAGGVTALPGEQGGRVLLHGGQILAVADLLGGRCDLALEGQTSPIRAVAVDREGTCAVTIGEDEALRVFALGAGRCVATIGGQDGVRALAVLPGGRHALLATDLDRAPVVIELTGDAGLIGAPPLGTPPGRRAQIEGLRTRFAGAIAAAHQRLEGGDVEGAIRGLGEARTVPGFQREPEAIEMCSAFAAAGHARGLARSWTAGRFDEAGGSGDATALALDSDGTTMLAGDAHGRLVLWGIGAREKLRTIHAHRGPLAAAHLLEDGARVLTAPAAQAGPPSGPPDPPCLWDLATGQPVGVLAGHPGAVESIWLTGGGAFAVSSISASTVLVHSLATLKLTRAFEGRPGALVAVSRSGRLALSARGEGEAMLWDLLSGARVRTFVGHTGRIVAAAIAPDERVAITASEDGTLRLWDTQKGGCLLVYEGGSTSVRTLALALEGQWVFEGGGEPMIRAWRLDQGQHAHDLALGSGGVRVLAVDAAGRFLLAGGLAEGVVQLALDWELDSAFSPSCIDKALDLQPVGTPPALVELGCDDEDRPFLFSARTLGIDTGPEVRAALPFPADLLFVMLPIGAVLAGVAAALAGGGGVAREIFAGVATLHAFTYVGVYRRRRWSRRGCLLLLGLSMAGFLALDVRWIAGGRTPDLAETFTRLVAIPAASGVLALAIRRTRKTRLKSPMSAQTFALLCSGVLVVGFLSRTPIGDAAIETTVDWVEYLFPILVRLLVMAAPPLMALLAMIELFSAEALAYFDA